MGYDLHITRKEDWGEEGEDIDEAEWHSIVDADPELKIVGFAEADFGDTTLRYESPLIAEWNAHPEGHQIWFDYRSGHVVAKAHDEPTTEKMKEIARKLKARVQGDDGEFYD